MQKERFLLNAKKKSTKTSLQSAFERELVDLVFTLDMDAITRNIRCTWEYVFGTRLEKLWAYVSDTTMHVHRISWANFRLQDARPRFFKFSWIQTLGSSWKLNEDRCHVYVLFISITLLGITYARMYVCIYMHVKSSNDWGGRGRGLSSRMFFTSLTFFFFYELDTLRRWPFTFRSNSIFFGLYPCCPLGTGSDYFSFLNE